MTTKTHAENEETSDATNPYGLIGVGSTAAEFILNQDGEIDFRIFLFREDQETCEYSRLFQTADIADLARLVQKLAMELSQKVALGREICDDLACLAACLEDVLPTGYVFPGIRCRDDGPAARMVSGVLDYLWEDEGRHFRENPASDHIYRRVVAVDAWLRGVGPDFGIELPDVEPASIEDYFGGCPICGRNDGYLNIHRDHWFNCRNHQLRWCAGSNLFGTWRSENEGDWNENFTKIGSFREVFPMLNPNDRPKGF